MNALTRARRAAHLTQIELAARTGLNRGNLSDLERGARRATATTLALLEEALALEAGRWTSYATQPPPSEAEREQQPAYAMPPSERTHHNPKKPSNQTSRRNPPNPYSTAKRPSVFDPL